MPWKADAPPSLADAERRLREIPKERACLDKEEGSLKAYVAALKDLTAPAPISTKAAALESRTMPNLDASSTGAVVDEILRCSGGAIQIDAILQRAKEFSKWERTGDDERDKERLLAALRRGRARDKNIRTSMGWERQAK
jgi:hypothetical protein